MQVLQLTIGHKCYNFCVETDAYRVKFVKRSFTNAAKDARRASFRKEEEKANINVEGQLYGADITD